MIGNIKKPAFTLLEVIVSVAIFSVIILAATQIFQSVISTQVKNYTEISLQDDIRYFLEVFTRDARNADKNIGETAICSGRLNSGQTYNLDGNILYFQNKLGECFAFYANADSAGVNRLIFSWVTDDGLEDYYISSERLDIQKLKFVVTDDGTTQPLVTLNLTVKSKVNPNLPDLNIQTSISPNWYAN